MAAENAPDPALVIAYTVPNAVGVAAEPPDTVPQDVVVPLVVRYLPEFDVCDGARASNAADAVVCPVPPFAIGKPVAKLMLASGNVTVRLAVKVVGVIVAT
jgi:hypothetical protein